MENGLTQDEINSISNFITNTSSDITIRNGGWVTDNYETYYLDKDMVKHKLEAE